MIHLLHLDSSARPGRRGIDPHGSYTRALSDRFVARWRAARPQDPVRYRDLGASPPQLVDHDWIRAEFTRREAREPWMVDRLAESDALVDELIGTDLLVIGAPLYNFGMPAPLKAWIDGIVRIGRTVEFDPGRGEDPYVPLLADRPRRVVLLSSRGGHGMDEDGPLAHMNHLDPHLRTALGFIGIHDLRCIAVEYEEFGDERLLASVAAAEAKVDALVDAMLAETAPVATSAPERALPA
ncbi:NAD(P)H-dependent oxidoreductase [Luteimonas sp. RD2P54]|uniref:FMN dependent NADH:quinone oxidoreductase n=1 Tax=Luteimonas endophytica TaxID=3042023 RepID=A0ABT6JA07_9GAMM|nr:NAD(P)H-dependent oxidoreductase [Luteimonas endophytica]MDH5823659.1 NAD(P)H-dependent oxidoreductase [Luteimonas endophytica]